MSLWQVVYKNSNNILNPGMSLVLTTPVFIP